MTKKHKNDKEEIDDDSFGPNAKALIGLIVISFISRMSGNDELANITLGLFVVYAFGLAIFSSANKPPKTKKEYELSKKLNIDTPRNTALGCLVPFFISWGIGALLVFFSKPWSSFTDDQKKLLIFAVISGIAGIMIILYISNEDDVLKKKFEQKDDDADQK